MKIEKLHIRNIASISSADIDFSHDLIDADGSPASLFLIAGETGTGKTIILDAITMALYKTTPRIKGVSAQKQNAFTDPNTGEEISIFSVEQYTRIGIGATDDCYSEVVFTGNDNKHYTARLTLGMKRNTRLREPEWSLISDDGTSLSKDKDIKERMMQAVGLSFEQFCRLSMLAQGQFAEFLCGDKKQRESILEQLTQTELFSRYGEVISLLYKEAKDSKEELAKTIQAQLNMLLTDEQLNEKKTHIEELKALQAEAKILKDNAEQLCTQADTFLKAQNELTHLSEQEQQYEETWLLLSASLLRLKEENINIEQDIIQKQQWINNQAPYAGVYSRKGELSVQMQNLENGLQALATKKQNLQNEKNLTTVLEEQLQKAKDNHEKALQCVQQKEQEIRKMTSQREQLRPTEVNNCINDINQQKNALQQLLHDYNMWQITVKAYDEAKQELQDLTNKKHEQQTIEEKDKAILDKAQEELDSQQRLYNLMKNSKEKAFQSVRAQLREGDLCPLCGNGVNMNLLQQNFDVLLDPLKEENQKLTAARDKAKQKYDESYSQLNKLQGQLTSHQNSIADIHSKAENAKQTLASNVKNFFGSDVALDNTLHNRITKHQTELDAQLNQQLTIQKEAETLQKTISDMNHELLELIKTRDKAYFNLTSTETKVNNNASNIANLEKYIKEYQTESDKLQENINAIIQDFYPDWECDIAGVRSRIFNSATEYENRTREFESQKNSLQTRKDSYQRMVNKQKDVVALEPEWTLPDTPAQNSMYNAEELWNNLHANLISLHTHRTTASDQLSEAKNTLAGWFDENDRLRQNDLQQQKTKTNDKYNYFIGEIGKENGLLQEDIKNRTSIEKEKTKLADYEQIENHWKVLNDYFGGTKLRTLVQTHILAPLLENANRYLAKITDRYQLTCDRQNEQLSILVHDTYNNRVRSSAVLSGGERFQISLALSLALSDLHQAGMNVDILFIDEGFGTLDKFALQSVMNTLQDLPSIIGQQSRRVGVISHREELNIIPAKILVKRDGRGKSKVICPYTGEYIE